MAKPRKLGPLALTVFACGVFVLAMIAGQTSGLIWSGDRNSWWFALRVVLGFPFQLVAIWIVWEGMNAAMLATARFTGHLPEEPAPSSTPSA